MSQVRKLLVKELRIKLGTCIYIMYFTVCLFVFLHIFGKKCTQGSVSQGLRPTVGLKLDLTMTGHSCHRGCSHHWSLNYDL